VFLCLFIRFSLSFFFASERLCARVPACARVYAGGRGKSVGVKAQREREKIKLYPNQPVRSALKILIETGQ
jgi:hypothetical protein